ncbi:MAG TPA: hypothetical protein PKX00_07895 [Opitutaceae bacterium]|jgi:hypothetical protein|nr:hypothetical protein [Opitutaceae bacterium]
MKFLTALRARWTAVPWMLVAAALVGWFATLLAFRHWPQIKDAVRAWF